MLTGLITYYTVGFSTLIVAIIMLAIAAIYRIREQAIRGTGVLFLSLTFLIATLFQNIVTERALLVYSLPYSTVKQLDVSIINPFKGPLITTVISPAAWQGYAYLITLVAVMILITGLIIAYMTGLLAGWSPKATWGYVIFILIIGAIGVAYTQSAVSAYLSNPSKVTGPLHARAIGNAFKALTMIIPWSVAAYGVLVLYKETKTLAYLVEGVGIALGLLGFLVFLTTWTYGWDIYVEHLAAKGSIAPAALRFATSAILMILGALTLLVGTIMEVMPTEELGFEEIPEEVPEEELPPEEEVEAAPEEAEGAGETSGEESGEA